MIASPSNPAAVVSSASPSRRRWEPNGDAHLIFRLVKMEFQSQDWVANLMGINQSTVSRILQRYERWLAHLKEREAGRLDHAERLRAQRQLTFERNELILASCMRIAREMEGFVDVSKSVLSRPTSNPSQETTLRTESWTLDRSGMAARFLRLAFRINMEQLKLAELDPPPPAPPLTEEELAEEARWAEADEAEIAAARRKAREEDEGQEPGGRSQEPGDRGQEMGAESPTSDTPTSDTPISDHSPASLHNLHNENSPDFAASDAPPCTCAEDCGKPENFATCITGPERPVWPPEEARSEPGRYATCNINAGLLPSG